MAIARVNVVSAIGTVLALVAASLVAGPANPGATARQVPNPVKTIWDGVYTEEQAERGRAAYDVHCQHCHGTGEAPALTGNAFIRTWYGNALDVPLKRMSTTMPADNPRSLPDTAYRDILAYLLKETGIPTGHAELGSDWEELGRVLIVEKGGIRAQVPNFSLVAVIGCLLQGEDNSWLVESATEPVRAKDGGLSPLDVLTVEASKPLGTHVFRFVQDFPAPGSREPIKGHKVLAKGLLIRASGDQQLNLTALQSLSETCIF